MRAVPLSSSVRLLSFQRIQMAVYYSVPLKPFTLLEFIPLTGRKLTAVTHVSIRLSHQFIIFFYSPEYPRKMTFSTANNGSRISNATFVCTFCPLRSQFIPRMSGKPELIECLNALFQK